MLGNAKISKKLGFQEAVRIAQIFFKDHSIVAQAQKEVAEKAHLGGFMSHKDSFMVTYVTLEKLTGASALAVVLTPMSLLS